MGEFEFNLPVTWDPSSNESDDQMCLLVPGRDIQAHLKQVSSSADRIEKATASIRVAQCELSHSDRMSASSSADGSRLSDGQREMVELAATELMTTVGQLRTTVAKLA